MVSMSAVTAVNAIRDIECWRVLKPDGTMVFKWSEVQIRLSEIRDLFPSEPICGNRVPKNSGTHWLVFFKPTEVEE
jgi:hypothetical protein